MTGLVMVTRGGGCGGGSSKRTRATRAAEEEEQEQQNQLSLVALLVAAIRKSMVACRVDRPDHEVISTVHQMEIGWPTDVQHITHVTFDRFNGFLGLPVEFEVEIPGRVPSASVSVFGVSAESMQCSYDTKGNSVPTILMLMQDRLYSQGGLKAEGIFRINPENSKEEHVRNQLNSGIVPDDIDVHCLAGLIKAWFRELPSGVLDGLSPEQVLQCNTEEESIDLVKQLKPTESALLSWAIDLMADVVQEEEYNKMNARNIAMVFAPNMTQMSDPLTALMHAVQVMNLLKTLITKTLREREETATGGYSPMSFRTSFRRSEDEYDSQRETETGGYSPMSFRSSYRPSEDEYESQREMDASGELRQTKSESQREMDASGELRQTKSDFDDHTHYRNSSEEELEAESLSEIEECFLKKLDEHTKEFSEEPKDYVQEEYVSSKSCCDYSVVEPAESITDIKIVKCCLSSDKENLNADTTIPLLGWIDTENVEMVDKFTDSVSPVPPLLSSS
ncbi:rho GTPase-activating protein 2-like isoform X3 [Trifolium pratense]|uniref:rho GTPase-activating protein 2-like isoform X2 n=1 Tax=Trifolium pratense TaxID=57577 RepID=UPI001E691F43|nr:rho GTPase-activating protein 2-like isoform X2 [Trifolium pratense]XP_045827233.1 rho GTPase-activating protein 2-like isoform X3 [Trifolium pratense]